MAGQVIIDETPSARQLAKIRAHAANYGMAQKPTWVNTSLKPPTIDPWSTTTHYDAQGVPTSAQFEVKYRIVQIQGENAVWFTLQQWDRDMWLSLNRLQSRDAALMWLRLTVLS